MQSRKNFFELPGGDTVQLTKTKEQLEKIGIEVDLSLDLEPDLSHYDIIHLSNLTRIQETYMQIMNAVNQNKPVVLSTIYWPMDDFEQNGQVGIRKLINRHLDINNIERIKAIARMAVNRKSCAYEIKNLIKIGYTKMQKAVIEHVNVFMPNSEIEFKRMKERFPQTLNRYVVVPNGIDKDIVLMKKNDKMQGGYIEYNNAVICVGRIETRKNQLELVKALANTDYKLILVGGVSANHRRYFEKIMKYIDKNKNFSYFPSINNETLYDLYKVCKVSALPSWLDTPGLVSLEAASMGCNLAISTRGSTSEYFGNLAYYCEPDNLMSIRNAIDLAMKAPKKKELQNLILEKYTWEKAAKQTLMAYEMALGGLK